MNEEAPVKPKSDLRVRTLSAIVMVAGAGTALWLSGWVWSVFVVACALGVLWEWSGLVVRISKAWWARAIWLSSGFGYVGIAAIFLIFLGSLDGAVISEPHPLNKITTSLHFLLVVMAVDIGAYFAGRAFGGPKIAPSISPSKTWAGLGGGAILASITFAIIEFLRDRFVRAPAEMPGMIYETPYEPISDILFISLVVGVVVAVIAQAGDFFESWMKRRAGVKDSGNLIPGHGGLFDRADGIIAVSFVAGIIMIGSMVILFAFTRSTLPE
jgi:phosphatidate cytidylyltransferase